MPVPPPPKPGDLFEYRAVGVALPQVQHGKRQIKWEDQSCSHTNHPDILNYEPHQRFECTVRYTYTGTNPKDLFEMTGPVLLGPKPLEPYVHDPVASLALWERVMANTTPVQPESPDVDENFWLKPKD